MRWWTRRWTRSWWTCDSRGGPGGEREDDKVVEDDEVDEDVVVEVEVEVKVKVEDSSEESARRRVRGGHAGLRGVRNLVRMFN
jgi:hypothetical protein